MSERKPGWYWVKWVEEGAWCVTLWADGEWCEDGFFARKEPVRVGPHVPTPDEPWRCVPVEATSMMLLRGGPETSGGARQDI